MVPLSTALRFDLTLLEGLTHPKGTTRTGLPGKGDIGCCCHLFHPGTTQQLKSSPGGFATRLFLTLQPNFTLPV